MAASHLCTCCHVLTVLQTPWVALNADTHSYHGGAQKVPSKVAKADIQSHRCEVEMAMISMDRGSQDFPILLNSFL